MFIGTTTNLRKLMPPLVRMLLPRTPTTGAGRARVPGLFRQWQSGRFMDLVVVWV